MKVKILLFPLSLTIVFAISIFWTKPEISSALIVKESVVNSKSRLEKVSAVVGNISTLDRSLNEKSEDERFVGKYLPKIGSDERILDQANFLAGESQILLVSAKLENVPNKLVQEAANQIELDAERKEVMNASPGNIFGGGSSSSTDVVFVDTNPESRMRLTKVSLSVMGKYDQIKSFVERMYRADYFHRFVSLKIGKDTSLQGDASESPQAKDPEILSVEAVVEFASLPEASVDKGSFLKAFEKPSFDYSIVENLRTRASGEILPLDASPSGRSNPFLR